MGNSRALSKSVPNFASLSSVLTPTTNGKAPNRVEWTVERDTVCKLCNCLCQFVVLTVPQPSDTFSLHTDASGAGLDAVLIVYREVIELPVTFYSRQLRGAEASYSLTELESLAILEGVEHIVCVVAVFCILELVYILVLLCISLKY